ncbi:MAG: phosphoadenylyl-sulfate reductase [Acidimicrobiia bacterium]
MTSELMELNDAARELEGAHPSEIVRWAHERHGDGLVVTSSFGDAILAHVVASAVPGIEIVLLDTQYLFAETLWYAEQLRRRFDVNLRVVRPDESLAVDDLWQTDTTACCRVRKVEPLERLLADRSAWVTGLRRSDSPSRRSTPVVSWDIGRSVVKVNPLAALTDDEVALYTQLFDLPSNPLTERGYPSIGCWPCTQPADPGEDARAGRWAGSVKTECGLHL